VWLFLLAPLVGGVLAALAYLFFVPPQPEVIEVIVTEEIVGEVP
jgi:hypothetical protein